MGFDDPNKIPIINPALGAGGGGASSLEQLRYVNPDVMLVDLGGWEAGDSFPAPGVTLQELLDTLLYPFQDPSFTSFAIPAHDLVLEVGDEIGPSGETFTWTTSDDPLVAPNSVAIRDMTNMVDLGVGLANDGAEVLDVLGPIQKVAVGSHQYRIQATSLEPDVLERFVTYQWRWRMFHGTDAGVTLDEVGIEALVSSALQASFVGTKSFVAGDYKYICYADSLGGASSFKDAATQLNIPMADVGDDAAYSNTENGLSYAIVNVTNSFGIAEDYRVYRTKYVLGAAIDIIVA